jgi:hypothetical protein
MWTERSKGLAVLYSTDSESWGEEIEITVRYGTMSFVGIQWRKKILVCGVSRAQGRIDG